MNYLEKLKLKISLPQELSLLPKVENSKKEPTSHTALTAKSTLGTLDSTMGGHILPFNLPEKILQQQHDDLWLQSDFLQSFSPLVQVTQGKKYTLDNCPARCKQTGKCYGTAYFDAKPGKTIDCIPNQCPWNDQLEQYLERDLK